MQRVLLSLFVHKQHGLAVLQSRRDFVDEALWRGLPGVTMKIEQQVLCQVALLRV